MTGPTSGRSAAAAGRSRRQPPLAQPREGPAQHARRPASSRDHAIPPTHRVVETRRLRQHRQQVICSHGLGAGGASGSSALVGAASVAAPVANSSASDTGRKPGAPDAYDARLESMGPSASRIMPLGLPVEKVPRHIAIIMDGNGRWALQRGRKIQAGHEMGVPALRQTVECCRAWGVKVLTVYAFSSENWGRSDAEVEFLMRLMAGVLRRDSAELAEEGVRLQFIGNLIELPEYLREDIARSEEITSSSSDLYLRVAMNYGSQTEIASAARELAQAVAEGSLSASSIDASLLGRQIVARQPPLPAGAPCSPDLLIRTSGEHRMSNFLLWESSYAELYFTDVLWPDFGEVELRQACVDYAARQRRYGKRI